MLNSLSASYIILAAAFLLLAGWILTIEIRMKKIFRGTKAKDLESVIASAKEEIRKLQISENEQREYLKSVEERLRNSIQKVRVIRFNPFEAAGSNQSFSVAFLNEHGNGTVISSLYSRDRVNIYAKPIEKYESTYTLSDEEREAIKKAKDNA